MIISISKLLHFLNQMKFMQMTDIEKLFYTKRKIHVKLNS